MTTFALIPYNGATRKGVEEIHATLSEANARSRAALEAAIRDNGETATDVFHPSERAFQTDWEKEAENRKRLKASDANDIQFFTAMYSIFTLAPLVASFTAFHSKTSASPLTDGLAFAFLALAVGIVGGVPYFKTLRKYLAERSHGHIARFLHWNAKRMHLTWAISDKAVYTVTREQKSETLTVIRIPFDEVQACAFREREGMSFADVYSKAGEFFTIIDPTSEKLSGAKNLVDLINAKAPKK